MGLKLNEQKEFEKMVAKINLLENELLNKTIENRTERERDNRIKRSLKDEIENMRRKNLELIRDNNKLSSKLENIHNGNVELKEFNKLSNIEKWQEYEENDTYNCNGEYDDYARALVEMEY